MKFSIPHLRRALLPLVGLLLSSSALLAQINLPGLGGDGFGGGLGGPKVEVEAAFTEATPERPAMLFITADIAPGFHIYSVGQRPGGPAATKIKLDSSPAYRVTDDFRPTEAPQVHFEKEIWPDLPIEEHHGKITWYAPLELAEDANPATLTITGKVDTQACDPNSCIPLLLPWVAKRVQEPPVAVELAQPKAPDAVGEYRPEGASVALRGALSQSVAKPGSTVQLVLTAVPDDAWHVYARESRDPEIIGRGKPTLIVVERAGSLEVSRPQTDAKPIEKQSELPGVGVERYHEGEVTWTIELQVPEDAQPGIVPIAGWIGYQACFENGCKPPMGVRFQADLMVGAQPAREPVPLTFYREPYGAAAKAAAAQPVVAVDAESEANDAVEEPTLGRMLVLGFLGGIVLNLMPCVLPVIGLKIMSFVEQAGHSRSEALRLNAWYSAGMIAVFLILAAMAVVLGMTWGEQFGFDGFNIALAAIVFAMALSLLGVWEIPIPGFVGGAKAHDLSSKEGPFGAFSKGVLTTVLATPCTGPFMGAALAWAVLQPASHTFAVFASIGLGMASPYLLIGAFPELIRFLPKPGAWMSTFKQVMGFVLLGTVIFLLTFIDYALIVPTVMLLTGIGVGCWWIARTPLTAELGAKLRAWAGGLAFTAAIGYVAFAQTLGTLPGWGAVPGLYGVMEYRLNRYVAQSMGTMIERGEDELPWQPFSPAKLAELRAQDKTVLVDFTADWCLICKTLEATVLNTEPIIDLVDQYEVETLLADYTRRPPEIKELLAQLESNGVPVLAIYPAGNPENPIVFRGVYTQSALLEALEQAGPSQPAAMRTAMVE